MKDRRVIPSSQDFSNVLERFVRHGTAQIHYDLTRMGQLLAPLLSGQIFRIDVKMFGYNIDDQLRRNLPGRVGGNQIL